MPAYITLDEAKAWLSLLDNADDQEIVGLIQAASAQLAEVMQQDIALQQTTEEVTGLGGRLLFPRRQPLVSVISAVMDGRSIAVVKRGETIYATQESFPAGSSVEITYTAGFAEIPETVKLATKMQVQALIGVGGYDLNFTGQNIAGIQSGAFGPHGPGGVRESVRNLLRPYTRRFVIA